MMNLNGNIKVSIKDKEPKSASNELDDTKKPEAKAINTVTDNTKKKDNIPPPLIRNRCNKCNKKLKLTAFKCKCDEYYCDAHVFSTCHDCPFDYKKQGKERLEKNNPLIMHKKIDKI
jgi:hypothetical protein